ncbi:hypothetical protein [Stetteria hydrogenophila]
MARRKGFPVLVWFTEEEYARLSREARSAGYETVGDYVRELALKALEAGGAPGGDVRRLADAVARRLERVVADLINPFTAKIDEVNRRVAELLEAVEAIESAGGEEEPQPLPPPARPARAHARRSTGRASGMDRLHEEGVVFESDLQWLRDPGRFFSKLQSQGARVLTLAGERVAVDPSFWGEFKSKLEGIGVRDLLEAAALLRAELGGNRGARAARLLEKLAKAGLAYYDEELGHWVVSGEAEGES